MLSKASACCSHPAHSGGRAGSPRLPKEPAGRLYIPPTTLSSVPLSQRRALKDVLGQILILGQIRELLRDQGLVDHHLGFPKVRGVETQLL